MKFDVYTWWILLSSIAVLNIFAWVFSVRSLAIRHENFFSAPQHLHRRWMMWLSAIYVAGCAFRSFFPRIDLERICLVQSQLSNIMLGRSVATVAELCFMAQCALLLNLAGKSTGHSLVKAISWMIFPMIAIAEFSSWYAILTTNYLGHFIENSIWTVSAFLILVSMLMLWPHRSRSQHHFLISMMIFAVGYIIFMLNVDLPMYWTRWSADQLAGTTYLSLLKGVMDAYQACVVDFSWGIWHQEIPWMTLYFTIAVWLSIYLPHVPYWINFAENGSLEPISASKVV